ncbi:MAG: glycosyltransferase [Clostridia bacterium]|nr:glycosyltransferase [Clostridia bacterium]
MKVIEALSDTNIGGAGRLLLTRLSNSDRGEFDTTVILPRGSMLEGEFGKIGVRVICFDGGADRSFDPRAIGSIFGIIKAESPDIINAHGCLSARIAAALCGVPVRIYTRHCAYEVPRAMRIFPIKQLVGGANMLLSNHTVAVADAARKNLVDMGVREGRIKVIINGVDGLRRYSDEERDRFRRELGVDGCFVVGICARIERCKGHECFLRAARILSRENEGYRFLIVGDGALRGECEALSRALGIEDRVIFTGFCRDVERYFNCMDINVNCSVGTETSSLALSEGMSIGLPAVVSSYGGNPYMVRHGENGFVYPVGDFFALADMIRRIAEDRELYQGMSSAAYARYLSELNSKKMTEQTEELYRELYREYVSGSVGLTS